VPGGYRNPRCCGANLCTDFLLTKKKQLPFIVRVCELICLVALKLEQVLLLGGVLVVDDAMRHLRPHFHQVCGLCVRPINRDRRIS